MKFSGILNFFFLYSSFFMMIVSCSDPEKPNILFIMSDDHGYQAISAYNPGLVQTPNIDRIVKEGIPYNKAFVTNSICASTPDTLDDQVPGENKKRHDFRAARC